MYWGDATLDKIETANLDGSNRKTILTENYNTHYFAFHLHAPNYLYISDFYNR